MTLGRRPFVPRQGNNSYIFPGRRTGRGRVARARITDAMFLAAARALAEQVTPSRSRAGQPLPAAVAVRSVSAHIAAAVAEVAFRKAMRRSRSHRT